MKKRLNLYIEEFVLVKAKKHKLNISVFLQEELSKKYHIEKKWVKKE